MLSKLVCRLLVGCVTAEVVVVERVRGSDLPRGGVPFCGLGRN